MFFLFRKKQKKKAPRRKPTPKLVPAAKVEQSRCGRTLVRASFPIEPKDEKLVLAKFDRIKSQHGI